MFKNFARQEKGLEIYFIVSREENKGYSLAIAEIHQINWLDISSA